MDDDKNLFFLTLPRWKDIFILSSMGSWYDLILTFIFLLSSIGGIIAGIIFLSAAFFFSGLIGIFSFLFGYMGINYINLENQTIKPIIPIK